MPNYVPGLILQQAGDVKNAKITIAGDTCLISDIQKYLKKKTALQVLGTFPYKGNTLHLFGYKEGKAGTENKHELPPPLDNQLFFGDILVLLSKEKRSFERPILMKPEEYEAFYTQMFEGFDSLGEEDDELEEDLDDELDDDNEEIESQAYDEEEEFQDDDEGPQEDGVDGEEKIEEDQVILPIKKKQPKVEKAKPKAKTKEPLYTFVPICDELQPSTSVRDLEQSEKHRLQVQKIIQTTFASHLTTNEQRELEHHIYNTSLLIADKKHITKHWKQPLFIETYLALARTILGNMSTTNYVGNKSLFQRFKDGHIDLQEIVQYGYSDLYPEIWKELSIRQFEREKRQLEGNKAMATDQFHCKRCGKKECTYYELQTRSADEPMTIFIQCVNCGKHWRQ